LKRVLGLKRLEESFLQLSFQPFYFLRKKLRAGIIILMLLGITSSCTKKDGLSPFSFSDQNSQIPLGRYQLMFYEDVNEVPYEIILEVKGPANPEGDYLINGRSVVNFYFSTTRIEATQKAFAVNSLGSTKIGGNREELEFESDYFERLSAVQQFELKSEGKNLILYPGGSKESFMTFKRAELPQ
jgi:hypothetical protein